MFEQCERSRFEGPIKKNRLETSTKHPNSGRTPPYFIGF